MGTELDYSKLRGRIKEIFGTQEKFADSLGISRAGLSDKLNGKSDFSTSQILKIADMLNLDNDEIQACFFTRKVKET